jgi:hypothetical protein
MAGSSGHRERPPSAPRGHRRPAETASREGEAEELPGAPPTPARLRAGGVSREPAPAGDGDRCRRRLGDADRPANGSGAGHERPAQRTGRARVFDGRPLATAPRRTGDRTNRRPALARTGREGHPHRPRPRAGSCQHPARHGRTCRRGRHRGRLFACAHGLRHLGRGAARRRSRRRNRCGLRRSDPRRQQCERIEITVRLRCHAHSEMDVRLGMLGVAARTDRADHVPFRDRRRHPNPDRPELDERHREAVRGTNRQRESRPRHEPRKADAAGGRGAYVGPRRRRDVDAAMLAARVGIVRRLEAAQHLSADRPRPCACRRRSSEREHDDAEEQKLAAVARFENHSSRTVPGRSAVVKPGYRDIR